MTANRTSIIRMVWSGPGAGLAVGAAILPVVALLASRGVVVVLAVSAGLCLWRMVSTSASGEFWGPSVTKILAGLVAWSLISLVWTLEPSTALTKWASTTAILGSALIMSAAVRQCDDTARSAIGSMIVAGVLAGVGLLALELGTGQKVAGTLRTFLSPGSLALEIAALNQGACVLAIMVWPAAAIVWRDHHRVLAGLLVGAVLITVSATISSSALLAVVVGFAVGIIVWWGGRHALRLTAISIAVLVAIAPVLPLTVVSPDRLARFVPETALPELHRLHMWEFTAQRIFDQPFQGWGFYASRFVPGGNTELMPGVPILILHPHNAALQVWLELGIPGAALFAAFLFVMLSNRCLKDAEPVMHAGISAMALAALTIGSLSYGLWQSWWLAALGLMAVVTSTAITVRKSN